MDFVEEGEELNGGSIKVKIMSISTTKLIQWIYFSIIK